MNCKTRMISLLLVVLAIVWGSASQAASHRENPPVNVLFRVRHCAPAPQSFCNCRVDTVAGQRCRT